VYKQKKADRYGYVPMQEDESSVHMERVHIDCLGPLSLTSRGNQDILMMVNQFTKWVECVPSQTADITAKAAVDQFFSRVGKVQIFSDHGRNVESKLFTSLYEVLEIHSSNALRMRDPSSNDNTCIHVFN